MYVITDVTNGCWNNQPKMGILCKKTARVGQKPLKSKPEKEKISMTNEILLMNK